MPAAVPALTSIGGAIGSGLSAIGGGSAAAGALTAAAAGSSLLGQRQARKQAEKANEMSAQLAAQRRADIESAYSKAFPLVEQGYGIQREVIGQMADTIPGYLQQTTLPQFELTEKGSRLGQDVIRGGMMAQIGALTGGPIDYSFAETRIPDFDYRTAVDESAIPLDLSAIDNAMALQGQATPTGSQTGYNAFAPGQMAFDNMSPEQIQMLQQMNMIPDKMRMAAIG